MRLGYFLLGFFVGAAVAFSTALWFDALILPWNSGPDELLKKPCKLSDGRVGEQGRRRGQLRCFFPE